MSVEGINNSKMNKKSKILMIIIGACIIILMVMVISNKFNKNYEQLSIIDQKILLEIDSYKKANEETAIWKDFNLEQKAIVVVDKMLGSLYLVNPKEDISSIFATKINMPKNMNIQVYKVSSIAPQTLTVKMEMGNFNTIGKIYTLFDNEVYFTKYSEEKSINSQFSSEHYITFLVHEAFHYYMQNQWSGGERFLPDFTEEDVELLREEYIILAKMQESLAVEFPSKEQLFEYTKSYIEVMDKRIDANPDYLKMELAAETAEGTATYVGIKASEIVGYDFGVMYFSNISNVSFAEVIPMLEAGKIEKSFIANKMPYETGALLCKVLEVLEAQGWQEDLNNQTIDNSVTLYSIIKDFVNEG